MSPIITTIIAIIILIAAVAGLWMRGVAKIHKRQQAELRRIGDMLRRHTHAD